MIINKYAKTVLFFFFFCVCYLCEEILNDNK